MSPKRTPDHHPRQLRDGAPDPGTATAVNSLPH
jgi:hypothetical protein